MGYDFFLNLFFSKLRISIFCSYIPEWRVINHILHKIKRKRVQDRLINISSYLAAQNAVDRSGQWTFQLAIVTFLDLGLIQNTGQQCYTVGVTFKVDLSPCAFALPNLWYYCFFLHTVLLHWLMQLPFSWSKPLMRRSCSKGSALLHFHGKAMTDHLHLLFFRLSDLRIFF